MWGLQAIIQSDTRRNLHGAKPHPLGQGSQWLSPAGLKPHAQGFLHLGHGGQGGIESLAEVSCLSPWDAVATVFLHMEYACVSAGYVQICGMKQARLIFVCMHNQGGVRRLFLSSLIQKPNKLLFCSNIPKHHHTKLRSELTHRQVISLCDFLSIDYCTTNSFKSIWLGA